MSFKFLGRLKETQSETDFDNVVCANCETQFAGHFCPSCGQAVKEYDKPFSFVFYNFLGDFFAFDTRFLRTIVALLFKPGFLSKEYIDGRRVRYAPPFRIFVFVSFVLFLMLQTYTNRGLTTVLDANIKDGKYKLDSVLVGVTDSLATTVIEDLDSTDLAATDSLLNIYGVAIDTTEKDSNLHFSANLETFRDTRDLRQVLNKYATVLEKKLEKEQDTKERLKIIEHIRLCRSPEQAMAKILKYISWAFFLLLPIFALILKLVYIRRKRNYMRHLIFSIHIHSFIFIVMIAIVGMYMTFSGNIETITSILVLVIPVYFIIAMKKFYGQGIGKVILKFFAVSFLYNFIFLIVVLGAALNALNLI
jgi:hypothetical protein